MIALRVKPAVNSQTSKVRVYVDGFTVSNNSTTRTSINELWINPGLIGAPSWSDVDAAGSVMEKDVTATDVSGGRLAFTSVVGTGSGYARDLPDDKYIELEPGDLIAMTVRASSGGGSAFQGGACTWLEGV